MRETIMKRKLNFKNYLLICAVLTFWVHHSYGQQSGAGNSLNFTGSGSNGSLVAVPGSASLTITNAITLEAWVKRSNAAVGSNRIFTRHFESYSLRIGRCCDQQVQFLLRDSGGIIRSTVSQDIGSMSGRWVHLAATWDGGGDKLMRIYINGAEASYPEGQQMINAPLTYAGTNELWLSLWVETFNGMMDQLRIWNVARTPQQIRDFMHKTENLTSETGLVSVWHFNEGSGLTTSDPVNGNNGTPVSCDRITSSGCTTSANAPTWQNSTAPFGDKGAFVNTTASTAVGPAGGMITATVTSTPDLINNLGVYQFGAVNGGVVTTGETFPLGFSTRSNIAWGVFERGGVTANLVFDYSGIPGGFDPSQVEILKRTDANDTSWELVTESSRDDTARTITVNGVTDFGEYAIGFPVAPTSAGVSVSGRVLTQKGVGIPRAVISYMDYSGAVHYAVTNAFGFYHFENVPAGEIYVFSVNHKKYNFPPQAVVVLGEKQEVNFTVETRK